MQIMHHLNWNNSKSLRPKNNSVMFFTRYIIFSCEIRNLISSQLPLGFWWSLRDGLPYNLIVRNPCVRRAEHVWPTKLNSAQRKLWIEMLHWIYILGRNLPSIIFFSCERRRMFMWMSFVVHDHLLVFSKILVRHVGNIETQKYSYSGDFRRVLSLFKIFGLLESWNQSVLQNLKRNWGFSSNQHVMMKIERQWNNKWILYSIYFHSSRGKLLIYFLVYWWIWFEFFLSERHYHTINITCL